MNILVLGGGGREHALIWAIAQNPKTDKIFCAPGNAGTAELAESLAINPESSEEVLEACETHTIDFVIIGPEAPLVAGVSDALRNAGILTFGPSQAAAQLEASKYFTKEICEAVQAPSAAYAHFKERDAAKAYVRAQGAPIVIKADGLAAGKGVIVATTVEEAVEAIDDMFSGSFGDAGAEVVIEEFMEGEEASFFILCDGKNSLPIGTAQDHKRIFDGDKGPNTGGMGAYSPAPIMDEALTKSVIHEIIEPVIAEMARRGTPYQGVLYAGLMIKDQKARLVEFNARFGDPECQVLMMRLGAQALDLLLDCARENLAGKQVNWADDHAITVVMAANGYPGAYKKGEPIEGIEAAENDPLVKVFHAGTREENGLILSNGGRVLNITARAQSLSEARDHAYTAIEKIKWSDGVFRKDIGWRALK